MAVPYEILEPACLAVAFGLALAFLIAPRIADLADGLPRARGIRLVTGSVLAMIVGVGLGLQALGAPIDPNNQPLHFGHAWGSADPRLLAVRQLLATSADTPQVQLLYAYSPGAEIRVGITLENDGAAPLTVTGIDSPAGPWVDSVQFRLPPQLSADLPPAYPNQGTDNWSSQPFHPFQIPAHGEVGLAAAVTLGVCPGMSPVPTLGPGASLMPESDPSLTGGFTALSDINVRYTAFGISRSAAIVLAGAIEIVTSARNVYGCPPAP
jgi:hypothetical protein